MAWPYPENEDSKSASKTSKKDAPVKRVQDTSAKRAKDPMEGVTLKMVLERLEAKYGWDELASRIRINCFANDPSINSSLKFLRRTPWARDKVEKLYLQSDWSDQV